MWLNFLKIVLAPGCKTESKGTKLEVKNQLVLMVVLATDYGVNSGGNRKSEGV